MEAFIQDHAVFLARKWVPEQARDLKRQFRVHVKEGKSPDGLPWVPVLAADPSAFTADKGWIPLDPPLDPWDCPKTAAGKIADTIRKAWDIPNLSKKGS
jgi:hypothetical protein